MKNFRIFAIASLFVLASSALAQTSTDTLTVSGTVPGPTVTLSITDTSGVDLATAYSLGQLNTSSYVYGGEFLLKLTYANVTTNVALAVSGSTTNYDLAYSHLASGALNPTNNVAFATSIGTFTTSGSVTDLFVKGSNATAFDGVQVDSMGATIFKIGAKAQNTAVANLSTTVTITATVQ